MVIYLPRQRESKTGGFNDPHDLKMDSQGRIFVAGSGIEFLASNAEGNIYAGRGDFYPPLP